MSNHLVIIEQSNDDSIIKVMTRKEIINRGRSGLTIIEGNLLKGFGQIMDLKNLIKGAHGNQTSYYYKKRSEYAKR